MGSTLHSLQSFDKGCGGNALPAFPDIELTALASIHSTELFLPAQKTLGNQTESLVGSKCLLTGAPGDWACAVGVGGRCRPGLKAASRDCVTLRFSAALTGLLKLHTSQGGFGFPHINFDSRYQSLQVVDN